MIVTTRVVAFSSAIGAVAVLAGGWFLGAQPMLDAAAAAEQSATAAATTNQSMQTELAGLAKQAAQLDSLRADDAVLQKSVPEILKPNTFVRRVNEVAAIDGVTVRSVTPSDATAYMPAPSAETAAPAASVEDGSVESADADEAAGAQLALTDSSITDANFSVVPVAVMVEGTRDAILAFSRSIQNDERTFLVSNIQISSQDLGITAATLSGYIYTLKR